MQLIRPALAFLCLITFGMALCGVGAHAQKLGPFTVAGNFPRDLQGATDSRLPNVQCNVGPCIWGQADSTSDTVVFHPPAGYRVRILKLRGDLIAWPKILDGDPPAPEAGNAGVLLGFSASNSKASAEATPAAEGCFVYIQSAIHGGQAIRAPFDYDYRDERVYLDPDGKGIVAMVIKLAAFLNTTAHPIHMEATYVLAFAYEKENP